MNVELNSSVTRLQKAARRLSERWAETKEVWNDKMSREFEEEFLWPIAPHLKLSIASIHELSEVLDHSGRECDDRPR